jgi:hypothetical protein
MGVGTTDAHGRGPADMVRTCHRSVLMHREADRAETATGSAHSGELPDVLA